MDNTQRPNLIIRQYHDLTDYEARFQEMKHWTEQRDADSPDQLWILQHPNVLTQGQAGKAEHILMATDIPVVQTDRGGQVRPGERSHRVDSESGTEWFVTLTDQTTKAQQLSSLPWSCPPS